MTLVFDRRSFQVVIGCAGSRATSTTLRTCPFLRHLDVELLNSRARTTFPQFFSSLGSCCGSDAGWSRTGLRIPDLNPDEASAVETPTTSLRGKARNRNLIISPAGDIQRDLIPAPSAAAPCFTSREDSQPVYVLKRSQFVRTIKDIQSHNAVDPRAKDRVSQAVSASGQSTV